VLSNHGGRQLDSCVAPIDVLPQIVRAVGERLTILVDSGFRRGTDIVKALALGAQAVISAAPRCTAWPRGEPGVERALGILSGEIHRVLGQLGCNSIASSARSTCVGPEAQPVRGALSFRGLQQLLEIPLQSTHRCASHAHVCAR